MGTKKKSGGMYVLDDVGQKHRHISIVLVSNILPLEEIHHTFLDKLAEWSDIIYIFPEVDYSGYASLSRKKFTSLYNGMAWTEENSRKSNIVECLIFSLSYILNVFSSYSGVSLINLNGVNEENKEKLLENLPKIYGSEIVQPVLNIQRVDPVSLFYLYMDAVDQKLGKGLFGDDYNNFGMYTRFFTSDPVIFLRMSTISEILKYTESKPDYTKSFSYLDTSEAFTFLASVIRELGLTNLNSSIEILDINKL